MEEVRTDPSLSLAETSCECNLREAALNPDYGPLLSLSEKLNVCASGLKSRCGDPEEAWQATSKMVTDLETLHLQHFWLETYCGARSRTPS